MQKTYCRFRFLNINHGPYLQTYFESSSEKFDLPTKKTPDEIQMMNGKLYSSMIRYRVSFDIVEINLILTIFYSASWLLKIISYFIIEVAIRYRNLTRITCYFVSISQKIHMIAFNAIAIDLIPYALRTLFQASTCPLLMKWISGVLLSLIIYDFCEVSHLGGRAKIESFVPKKVQENQDGDISQVVPLEDENTTAKTTKTPEILVSHQDLS